MTAKFPSIPISKFFQIAILGNLVYGAPVFACIWLLNLLEIQSLFFIFIPIVTITLPISVVICWLIAKGSNWQNTAIAIKITMNLPGKIYGFLLGGLLGSHFINPIGGIFGALLFYFLASATTMPVHEFIAKRVIPTK